jgi:hypothetical protein
MSDRERWVIYPLLFLALGAALRDKLIDQTTTKSLVCQELLVMDEQPLGREPVLLARIGPADRSDSKAPPTGHFVLNGEIEVVDRDPSTQPAKPLVAIRRASFGANAMPGGSIEVNGQVSVNGAINAAIYAYHGQPILPVLRGVPGASIPAELLQSLPEALRNRAPVHAPNAGSPQPSNSQPPAQPSAAPPAAASELSPQAPGEPQGEESKN